MGVCSIFSTVIYSLHFDGFTYSVLLLDPSGESAGSQISRHSLFKYYFCADGQNGNKSTDSSSKEVNKNSDIVALPPSRIAKQNVFNVSILSALVIDCNILKS